MDVASGIAGLISLSFTLFRGCVQGFQLISDARNIGNDADRVRSMLDWEQCRLLQWGQRAGLDSTTTVQDKTMNWSLVTDLLRQLQDLLTNASTLQKRYNLTFVEPEMSDGVSTLSKASTAVESLPERKGIGKLWSYVKPDVRSTRASIIAESASPAKKLRWAAMDHEKLRRLICDIGYFNSCLYDLLRITEQDFVRATLSALLRDLVSRTVVSSDLDIIKALLDTNYISDSTSIEAAATLKQIRLLLSIDKRDDEKVPARVAPKAGNSNGVSSAPARQTVSKLNYQALLRANQHPVVARRELAFYKSARKNINSRVLVEWKSVEKAVEEKLKRRIEGLTLLMRNTADKSFHSLKCLGYLRHEMEGNANMYAYVYEVINLDEDASPPTSMMIRPLSSLYSHKRTPSLTVRFQLALVLAETVLQLHTSGWLHKGIHSENVLFFDTNKSSWESGTSLGPYVAGYEFARADNPLEMTEDAPCDSVTDLYRHPQAQGAVRPSFKKIFDLYALGCVLIEIALWSSLPDILFNAGNLAEAATERRSTASLNEQKHLERVAILRGKDLLVDKNKSEGIFDRVAFHAGDNYRRAVELCFFGNNSSAEDSEESVDTQMAIVRILEQQKY